MFLKLKQSENLVRPTYTVYTCTRGRTPSACTCTLLQYSVRVDQVLEYPGNAGMYAVQCMEYTLSCYPTPTHPQQRRHKTPPSPLVIPPLAFDNSLLTRS